jgi:hypothetical protein
MVRATELFDGLAAVHAILGVAVIGGILLSVWGDRMRRVRPRGRHETPIIVRLLGREA